MKRNLSKFAKIYMAVICVFVVVLVVTASVLWAVLDAYESTRPKHVAQEVFDNYFLSLDMEKLLEHGQIGNDFETDDKKSYVLYKQLKDKELQYFSVSRDEQSQKYAVTADGARIAYFTLVKDNEKQGFGFLGYRLSNIELFAAKPINKTILVPEGYVLTINSLPVGEEYLTKTKVPHEKNEYLPSGADGLFLNEYTVLDFCEEPQITVTSSDGKETQLVKDAETSVISAQLVNDESLQREFSEQVIRIASIYTAVMSKDAEKSELYQYIDKSSAFYKKIKSVDTWFWPHDGHKIKNEEASQFYRHSDGVFSCRVKLTQELYLKKETEINNVDLILYMRKINGKYLLYNAATNG